jgi:hypothetical protein
MTMKKEHPDNLALSMLDSGLYEEERTSQDTINLLRAYKRYFRQLERALHETGNGGIFKSE